MVWIGVTIKGSIGFRLVLGLEFGKQSMTSNLALVMDTESGVEETMKALEVLHL